MAAAKKTAARKNTALTVEFEFERATKNTFRFAEVAEDGAAVIGTLYMQKSAFNGAEPSGVTLTVTPS
jgi:hypothetical protein